MKHFRRIWKTLFTIFRTALQNNSDEFYTMKFISIQNRIRIIEVCLIWSWNNIYRSSSINGSLINHRFWLRCIEKNAQGVAVSTFQWFQSIWYWSIVPFIAIFELDVISFLLFKTHEGYFYMSTNNINFDYLETKKQCVTFIWKKRKVPLPTHYITYLSLISLRSPKCICYLCFASWSVSGLIQRQVQ